MQNRSGHVTAFPDDNTAPALSTTTEDDHAEARRQANLCQRFEALKRQGYSGNQAAASLGKAPSWFSIHFPRFQREGEAAFLPPRRALGAGRRLFTDLPGWFLSACRFYYLLSNLNGTQGSVPEAIRRAVSLPVAPNAIKMRLLRKLQKDGYEGETLPECPTELREAVFARQRARKPLLPESITRLIALPETVVRQFRNPTDAGLDYISAHGTQMWCADEETGEQFFLRGGDMVEADDATINFPCVVPWPMRGCACSEKWEVKVARFQWLVFMDVGSRKVLGYCYTARPKSSYRGEDVVAGIRGVCKAHGIPRRFRFEKGVWKSNLVVNALDTLGVPRREVYSPHQKPFIEGLFNKLWTKLSVYFPEAHVGRFRGENEEANRLLTSCQSGAHDPRRYFPILAEVIQAFEEVIAENNSSPVRSANYGEWVPNERWALDMAANPLTPLATESDWIFSPFVRQWQVAGCSVGGRVPLFPGTSVPYNFSAPELHQFHGALVRAYFDPHDPDCFATIALAQPWGNHRLGAVIARAPQVNKTTDYIRFIMGFGAGDDRHGLAARRLAATALRREVRVHAGKATFAESVERDGAGNSGKIEFHGDDPSPAEATSRPCGAGNSASQRGLNESPCHPAQTASWAGENDGAAVARSKAEDLAAIRRFEEDNKYLLT